MNSKSKALLRILTAVFMIFFMGIPAPQLRAQAESVQGQLPGLSANAKAADLGHNAKNLSVKKDSLTDHQAVIFEVKGDVRLLKNGDGEWKKAEKGLLLEAGDQILTGEKSSLEFAYDEFFLNIVRIDEKTKAEFRSIEPTDLYMEDGTIFSALDGLGEAGKYQISTPTAVAAVRGTEFIAMDNIFATNDQGDAANHAVDVNGTLVPEGMMLGPGGLGEITPEIQNLMDQGLGNLSENIDSNLQQQGLEALGFEAPAESQNQNLEGDKPAEDQAPEAEGDDNKNFGGNPPNDGSGGGPNSEGDQASGPLSLHSEQAADTKTEAMIDHAVDALIPPEDFQSPEGSSLPTAFNQNENAEEGEDSESNQGQGENQKFFGDKGAQKLGAANLPLGNGPAPTGPNNTFMLNGPAFQAPAFGENGPQPPMGPGPVDQPPAVHMDSLMQFFAVGDGFNHDPLQEGAMPQMEHFDFAGFFDNLGFEPEKAEQLATNFTQGFTTMMEHPDFNPTGFIGGATYTEMGPMPMMGPMMGGEFGTFLGDGTGQYTGTFGDYEGGAFENYVGGEYIDPVAYLEGLNLNELAQEYLYGDAAYIYDAALSYQNPYYFSVLYYLEQDLTATEKNQLLTQQVAEILRGAAVLGEFDADVDDERISGVRYFADPTHTFVNATYDKILDDPNATSNGAPPLQVSGPTSEDNFFIYDVCAHNTNDSEGSNC
ncbi:MAG: hypothetical protein HYZ85_01710 [Candidatus Omnitrophica bacterium]|nr:hypothetical protein [Candidatus Omnitrophota bacterium]